MRYRPNEVLHDPRGASQQQQQQYQQRPLQPQQQQQQQQRLQSLDYQTVQLMPLSAMELEYPVSSYASPQQLQQQQNQHPSRLYQQQHQQQQYGVETTPVSPLSSSSMTAVSSLPTPQSSSTPLPTYVRLQAPPPKIDAFGGTSLLDSSIHSQHNHNNNNNNHSGLGSNNNNNMNNTLNMMQQGHHPSQQQQQQQQLQHHDAGNDVVGVDGAPLTSAENGCARFAQSRKQRLRYYYVTREPRKVLLSKDGRGSLGFNIVGGEDGAEG